MRPSVKQASCGARSLLNTLRKELAGALNKIHYDQNNTEYDGDISDSYAFHLFGTFLYIFGMATVFKFVVWLPLGSRHPLVTSCPLVLVVVGGGGSARAHVHNPISYVEIRYADSVHLLYLLWISNRL